MLVVIDDPMKHVSGQKQVSFITLKRFYQIKKYAKDFIVLYNKITSFSIILLGVIATPSISMQQCTTIPM